MYWVLNLETITEIDIGISHEFHSTLTVFGLYNFKGCVGQKIYFQATILNNNQNGFRNIMPTMCFHFPLHMDDPSIKTTTRDEKLQSNLQ